MHKLAKGLLIGCMTALALVGCFKVKQTIKINPDGTGTIEQTMGLKKDMIEMMEAMSKGSDTKTPSFEEQMKGQAQERAQEFGEGVEFKEIKKKTEGDMVYYTSIFSFKDITKISTETSNLMKGPPGGPEVKKEPEPKKHPITFEFKKLPDGSAELIVHNPMLIKETTKEAPKEGEKEEGEEGQDEMAQAMAKQMFKDMSMSLTLICGNQIIETNATNVEGNQITLVEINFGKLMENEKKFNEFQKKYPKQPEDPAEAMKALKEIFGDTEGLKMELEEKIKVKFK